MTEGEKVCRALRCGDYRVTLHARHRMSERMISDDDIMECGRTASRIRVQGDGKYVVEGSDRDGECLTVVCAWSGETIVITLF